jgi:hypothetical protein
MCRIKGQFIIIATIDALSTVFPGGAYRQGLISNWMHGTVPKQADGKKINTVASTRLVRIYDTKRARLVLLHT